MAKKVLPSSARKAWANAPECNCGAQQDNNGAHKQCFRCGEPMEYGAYEGWCEHANPSCWNVEHLVPKSLGGTDQSSNLMAVHKKCNK